MSGHLRQSHLLIHDKKGANAVQVVGLPGTREIVVQVADVRTVTDVFYVREAIAVA